MKTQLKIYKIVLPSKYRPENNFYDCHVICAESEKESIKLALEKGGEIGWSEANPIVQGIYTGRLKSSHVIASSFNK